MSFIADKKRQHEDSAEKALNKKDYAKAFFHTAKAAECGLKLAEQHDGKIASRYVADAYDLIEIASQMKTKALTKQEKVKQAIKEGHSDTAKSDEELEKSYQLREKPDLRLADVAGMDEVKQILREKVIYPFQHPEAYERFKLEGGGGVILYGPPGNGKTFVARAIAGELDAAFFEVRLSEMKSKYVGETAKNLTKLFEEARTHDRAVLFLDECEALLAKRGNRKVDSVPQFLALTDGLIKADNCMLLLAATNKPWQLDDAVIRPGRLGTHIYVGLPDAAARGAIVQYHMKDVPLAGDVHFDEIAAKTEGFSGADMAEISRKAKQLAVRRQISAEQDQVITAADFEEAVRKIVPSTTPEGLAEFEKWRKSRDVDTGDEDDD